MRPAELLLLGTALPLSVALATGGLAKLRMARIWYLIVLAALAIHMALEGLYWQMAAAYVGCLVLTLAIVFASRWRRVILRVAAGLAALLLFASAAALIVLPKFRLPQPTGPSAIGTRILHLEDAARPDTAFTSGHRELMVQVWYPAQASSAPFAEYRRAAETTWLSSYDAVLATRSRQDAPILKSAGPLPVLLFNPAWQGQRTQNTFETEELASHGFFVVAIDHTHNSEPIAFPDGRIVDSAGIRDIEDFSGVSYQQQLDYGNAEVKIEARDDSFVLDALTRLNADASSPWYRSLDFDRVGAFGHSFGGAVSLEAAFLDPRIRAAVNMDGWIFGDLWRHNFSKALLLIYQDPFPPPAATLQAGLSSGDRNTRLISQLDLDDLANVKRTLSTCGGYVVTIRGTRHFNFSDRALYSPFRKLTEAGSISPQRAHRIINDYTLAFFNQELNQQPDPLLREPSAYPEAHFEHHIRQDSCAVEPGSGSAPPPATTSN